MIECLDCGWYGEPEDCVCSEEDDASNKPVNQIKFDRCPKCGGQNFEDLDDDDE